MCEIVSIRLKFSLFVVLDIYSRRFCLHLESSDKTEQAMDA